MYLLCWSAKGGVGTTVVAAALAVVSARSGPTVLVDIGGDAPAALGIEAPTVPGLGDWWASPHAPADALLSLATPVRDGLRLVHAGTMPSVLSPLHAERLAVAAARHDTTVVIDAGSAVPHEILHRCADASLLVIRPCYLAIRRAVVHAGLATGIVVVTEPGRALGATDIANTLGAPVVAQVPWDPAVARAVDSGSLAGRVPPSLARPVSRIAATVRVVR